MGDSATWKHKTGMDGYGTPTFSSTTIACDIVYASRVVRTVDGDEIQCSALLTCVEALVPGDTVTISGKDWPVLGIVKVAKDNNRVVQWQQVAF
jgi:hypothetical protein